MELTGSERMLLELLQEKEAQTQRESRQRMTRFMTGVAERTGIPLNLLGINPQTGEVTDARSIDAAPMNGVDDTAVAVETSD